MTEQEFTLLQQLVKKFETHCGNVQVVINTFYPDDEDVTPHTYDNCHLSGIESFDEIDHTFLD